MSLRHLSLSQEETWSSSDAGETETDSHANSDDDSMATRLNHNDGHIHHLQHESDGFLSSTLTNRRISIAQSTQTQSKQYIIAEESDHEFDMDTINDTQIGGSEHLQALTSTTKKMKSISKSITTRRRTNSHKYTQSVSDHDDDDDDDDMNEHEVYDIHNGEPPLSTQEHKTKKTKKNNTKTAYCCFMLFFARSYHCFWY